MSFPSLSSLTVNCEKLENLELLIARNLAGLLLRPINLPLFFKRRVEKKKFEGRFRFPGRKRSGTPDGGDGWSQVTLRTLFLF